MESEFKCNQCGLCCKNIHLIDELKDFHQGDGICKYLDIETNLCKIYEIRPDICNVEKSYENYYSQLYSREDYLQLNQEGCMVLWKKKRL